MGQGSTVRLRQPRGAGQTRDAASGFPRFGVAFPFTARPCSFSRCVLSPHPGEVVNSSKRPFRERSYQTHIRPSGRHGRAVALQLHCFFLLPMGEGGPAHRSAEREGSGAGDEGRLFQRAAIRPSPCTRKKRAAHASRCAQPSPTGGGKVALGLHCFSLSESNIPERAHGAPCHPGSAAGAIRDGTESHAEARTARRDDPGQRVRRPVARLSLAVVRAVSSRMSRPGSPLRVGRDDKEVLGENCTPIALFFARGV